MSRGPIRSARWFAPGRVNLIGDHTDYQLGWVLPFAIAEGVTVTIDLTSTSTLQVRSSVYGSAPDRPLHSLAHGPAGWSAYLQGAVALAMADGMDVPGVSIGVEGGLAAGSGLASSAAVTCATLAALHEALGNDPTPSHVAAMAQRVENDYVGAGVGYLDPAAIMFGQDGHALAIDTRARSVEPVRLPAAEHGLALVLVNTMRKHRTSGRGYQERVLQCREAAAVLGVSSLRDVLEVEQVATINDPVIRARARHVVSENRRVRDVVTLLRAGHVREIGAAMLASHASLREDFAVSTPELDAVVMTATENGALGARMTGAGFGGSVLVLCDEDLVVPLTTAVTCDFEQRGWPGPTVQLVTPSGGACRIG